MSDNAHLTLSLLPPNPGEGSLLERLLALGLDVPHGCRNGNCWHCRARLLAGHVRSTAQTEALLGDDEILLCRSHAPGPVTLELDCGAALQTLPCERGDLHNDPDGQTLQLRWAAGRRRLPQAGQSVILVIGVEPITARVSAVDVASRQLMLALDDAATPGDGSTATVYFTATGAPVEAVEALTAR